MANSLFERQAIELAEGIKLTSGTSDDIKTITARVFELNALEVTKKWEARCKPFTDWVAARKDIAWFVSSQNVLAMGNEARLCLSEISPGLVGNALFERLFQSWYSTLTVFALYEGCPIAVENWE